MTIKITITCEDEVPADQKVEVVAVNFDGDETVERNLKTLEQGESVEEYVHSGQRIEVREVLK